MIKKHEYLMSDEEYNNEDWFPNYLIFCRPIFEYDNESGNVVD